MPSAFQDHWELRGHVFGTCMSHANTDLIYINIPKNASSWTKPNLTELGWEFYNYIDDNLLHKHAIIVLRDPIERWLSGICEYFTLYHPDADLNNAGTAFWELLVDRVTFDDHTEKQIFFIDGVNLNNATFFYCNEFYRMYIQQFLRDHGFDNSYSHYKFKHTTEESDIRKKFKSYFEPLLQNEKYKNHIKKHFAKDYDLINTVKFYGSR